MGENMNNTDTPARTSTLRGRPVLGPHTVAVQFGAWGPQRVQVGASGGGGRDDLPYVAVTVGDCLTYVYDRAALASHVRAWQDAAALNRGLRLPEQPVPADAHRHAGQDLALVCTVQGAQRHTVTGAGEPTGPVLTVVVGAVTVRVHTTTALVSYLTGWTRADALAAILDTPTPALAQRRKAR